MRAQFGPKYHSFMFPSSSELSNLHPLQNIALYVRITKEKKEKKGKQKLKKQVPGVNKQ